MKKAVTIGIIVILVIVGAAYGVFSTGTDSVNLEIEQPEIQEPKGKILTLELKDGILTQDTP